MRALLGAMLSTVSAFGQSTPASDAAIQPKTTLNLCPGVPPGSESAHQQGKEQMIFKARMLRNVVTPTLTVYLPSPSLATGTGVIIAPGGAFMMLSIDSEGHEVPAGLRPAASPPSCSSTGSRRPLTTTASSCRS